VGSDSGRGPGATRNLGRGLGFLIGSLGVGAILGGLALHWLRERVALETQVRTATVAYALTLASSAVLSDVWTLCPALVLGGAAWSIALTSLSSALLTSVPMWVRSRTIALSMLASQGFMAGGAALWGVVASHGSSELALALASGLMVILMIWVRRYPVEFGAESDVTLSPAEVQPQLSGSVPPEAGRWRSRSAIGIDPRRRDEFLRASEPVGRLRRRNGARIWRLYRDLADESVYVERFIVDSWVDYQRQLARSTVADHEHEERIRSFLAGRGPDRSVSLPGRALTLLRAARFGGLALLRDARFEGWPSSVMRASEGWPASVMRASEAGPPP